MLTIQCWWALVALLILEDHWGICESQGCHGDQCARCTRTVNTYDTTGLTFCVSLQVSRNLLSIFARRTAAKQHR